MKAPNKVGKPHSETIASAGAKKIILTPITIGSRDPTGPIPNAWTMVAKPDVKIAHWIRKAPSNAYPWDDRIPAKRIGTDMALEIIMNTCCIPRGIASRKGGLSFSWYL
jgi:hypothetical protein